MRLFILGFLIASLFIFGRFAHAEWEEFDNPDVVINYSNAKITVKENGLATIEEERMFTSRNETGRNRLTLETVAFAPDLASVQIMRASSITDGVETPIDIKTIHERTAAGTKQGISGLKELVIPFTNLKIGSSIKYKIFIKEKKSTFAGAFSTAFAYGVKEPELGGEVIINSKKKLNYAAIDAIKALEITEGTDKGNFTLKIKMLKPVSRKVKEENIPIYNHDSFPMVQVTTLQNWGEFVNSIAPKYEKVLSQELPASFKEIVTKAEKKKDIYEKIDTVTSELASVMTYSGNWTTLDKMFFPRSHAEVAKLKTGDCKDFATSTVAMLRKLGIKATVGLVNRKSPYDPGNRLQSLPLKANFTFPIFNHAIVRVEMPDKSILWVDPTNTTSNSKTPGIDIAESAALNLEKDIIAVEIIPASKILDHQVIVEKSIKITPDDKAETVGTLMTTGFFSSQIKDAAFLRDSKAADEVVLALFGSIAKEGVQADYQSRVAGTFKADLKTYGENIFIESEGKKSLVVVLPRILEFYGLGHSKKRVTDFFGAPTGQFLTKIQVDGFDFDENETTGCWAASSWFEIERKLLKNEKGFEVRDIIQLKKDFISSEDLRQKEYGYSLSDISDCMNAQKIELVSLDPQKKLADRLKNYNVENINKLFDNSARTLSTKAHTIKVIADQLLEKDPENLELLLFKVRTLRPISYRVGSAFGPTYLARGLEWLDKILEKQPENSDALIQKSLIYCFLDNLPEAKAFFNKAYYASKIKSFELYRLGGYIAEKQKDFKVAKKSYLKAIEVAKLDSERSRGWVDLGGIASDQNDHAQAEDYYTRALSYDKDNVWMMNDLLLLAKHTENYDKAIEIGEKILSKAPNFGIARSNLAGTYCDKANKAKKIAGENVQSLEAARDIAMKGLKYASDHLQCHWTLAQVYQTLSQAQGSVALAERSADSWAKAAQFATSTNDRERALAAITKVKKLKESLGAGGRMPASQSPVAAPAVQAPLPAVTPGN